MIKMKKVLLLPLMLVFLATYAQHRPRIEHNPRNSRDGQSLSMDQRAILKAKEMTLLLDLSPEQREKVKEVFLNNAKMRKDLVETHKSKKQDEDGKSLSTEERFAFRNQMLDMRIAQQEAMKKILNPDQYNTWKKLKVKAHHKGRKNFGNKRFFHG